jgi:molecular chaperone GrpE
LSQEESDAGSTGYSVAGDRPVFTKEAPTLLVTAVQSLRQALMNDGDSNRGVVVELDAFLGHSLISKMNTLDAQLRTARDRILRIRA